jgi:hypothetical protein
MFLGLKLTYSRLKISFQPQANGVVNEVSTRFDLPTLNSESPPRGIDFVIWKPDNEPPPKRQRLSAGGRQLIYSFVHWKSEGDISLQDVEESYTRAKENGHLRSSSLPRLESKSSDLERWDPYTLKKKCLSSAQLDEEKLQNIEDRLKQMVALIPKATQWTAETKRRNLTSADLYDILLITLGCDKARQTQRWITHGEMPVILKTVATLLDRVESLEAEKTVYTRVIAVNRIVAYALMRVCEVVDELTPNQASSI